MNDFRVSYDEEQEMLYLGREGQKKPGMNTIRVITPLACMAGTGRYP
jgi:hypothetical protein